MHTVKLCQNRGTPSLGNFIFYKGQQAWLPFVMEEDTIFIMLDSKQTYLLLQMETLSVVQGYINILEREMMPLLARHADLKEIYRNLRVHVFVNIYQSYTTICVYTAICTSKTKRSYKTNKKRIKCEKIKGNRKTGILCYTISSYILIRLSLIRARKLFLLTIVSLALTMHVLNLFIK